ncbi:MAG: hypothetical protein ACUVRD_00970 [Bacteroidia bacterium]
MITDRNLFYVEKSPSSTPQETLKEFLAQLTQELKILQAGVYLRDPSPDSKAYTWYTGIGTDTPTPQTFDEDNHLLGEVLKSKEPLSLQAHPLFPPAETGALSLSTLHVKLIPLLYAGESQGLLALSSLSEMPDDDLKPYVANVAAYLQDTRSKLFIQSLLENLQLQNQELISREEELRQNLEELSATQEGMQQTQKILDQRTRLQKFVIDTFILMASATEKNFYSLLRIALSQIARFFDLKLIWPLVYAEGKLHTQIIWKDGKSKSLIGQNQGMPLPDDLTALLESQDPLRLESINDYQDKVSIFPYRTPIGLWGILVVDGDKIEDPEIKTTFQNLTLALFTAYERTIEIHRNTIESIHDYLSKAVIPESQKLSYEELLAAIPTRSDDPQKYEEDIKNVLQNFLPSLYHAYPVQGVLYNEIFINANPILGRQTYELYRWPAKA